MENTKISSEIQIKHQFGKGGFGQIYLAILNKNKNREIAIKTEKMTDKHAQLYNEFQIYRWLHSNPDIKYQAFPQAYYYGIHNNTNLLALDLLGPSIHSLWKLCDNKLTLSTVIRIGDAIIQRLQFMHGMRVIHRDLKPANITIGSGLNSNQFYLIDLGLSTKYITSSGKHIAFKDKRQLIGTAKYCSLRTSAGIVPSRRDDLESLFNVLIYLRRGKLPWTMLRTKDKKLYHSKILEIKKFVRTETMCEGFPEEFKQFLRHIRELSFDEKPDYDYLRSLLKSVLDRIKVGIKDMRYDWEFLKSFSDLKNSYKEESNLDMQKYY